jgi:uncharacterized protein
LRVVASNLGASEFGLVPDPHHRLPGRGAHLHPELACLAQAEKRRAFGRALRVTGVPDTSDLRAHLDRNDRETPVDNEPRMVGSTPPPTSKVGRPT